MILRPLHDIGCRACKVRSNDSATSDAVYRCRFTERENSTWGSNGRSMRGGVSILRGNGGKRTVCRVARQAGTKTGLSVTNLGRFSFSVKRLVDREFCQRQSRTLESRSALVSLGTELRIGCIDSFECFLKVTVRIRFEGSSENLESRGVQFVVAGIHSLETREKAFNAQSRQ